MLPILNTNSPKCQDPNRGVKHEWNLNRVSFEVKLLEYFTDTTMQNIVDRGVLGAYTKDPNFDYYATSTKCRLVIAEITSLYEVDNSNPKLLFSCIAKLNDFAISVDNCPVCSSKKSNS